MFSIYSNEKCFTHGGPWDNDLNKLDSTVPWEVQLNKISFQMLRSKFEHFLPKRFWGEDF